VSAGCLSYKKLSCRRDRATLRVTEYFAKSLKIIQAGTIRKLGYGFLFAFHSSYGPTLYHFRDEV